jgi:hypothetical protein
MKRLILLLLFINVFQADYTQIVQGIVLDKSDNNRIYFDSIYINGTNIGTSSDQRGYFESDITKYSSTQLTIRQYKLKS